MALGRDDRDDAIRVDERRLVSPAQCRNPLWPNLPA